MMIHKFSKLLSWHKQMFENGLKKMHIFSSCKMCCNLSRYSILPLSGTLKGQGKYVPLAGCPTLWEVFLLKKKFTEPRQIAVSLSKSLIHPNTVYCILIFSLFEAFFTDCCKTYFLIRQT